MTTFRRRWRRFVRAYNKMLDDERIVLFQVYVYYPIFIGLSLYLWLVAQGVPQPIDGAMGTATYNGWVALGLLAPSMTLFGKILYARAAKRDPDQPNSAYGGAVLQFWGDFGVWGMILVYVACVWRTSWWGQAVWGLGFVLMGIPGGFFFTARSLRRLRQIRNKHRYLSEVNSDA